MPGRKAAGCRLNAVTAVRRRKRSPKVLTPELEQRILDTTLKTRPGDGGTHQIEIARCAARSSTPPEFKYADYGFRVAGEVQ